MRERSVPVPTRRDALVGGARTTIARGSMGAQGNSGEIVGKKRKSPVRRGSEWRRDLNRTRSASCRCHSGQHRCCMPCHAMPCGTVRYGTVYSIYSRTEMGLRRRTRPICRRQTNRRTRGTPARARTRAPAPARARLDQSFVSSVDLRHRRARPRRLAACGWESKGKKAKQTFAGIPAAAGEGLAGGAEDPGAVRRPPSAVSRQPSAASRSAQPAVAGRFMGEHSALDSVAVRLCGGR